MKLSVKLSVAAAALFLAATAAIPASAATRTPDHAAPHAYRNGYHAYAVAPAFRSQMIRGWGHCVSSGDTSTTSAYPSWDVCQGR